MPASFLGVLVTAAFAVAARALRGATTSGAVAGFFLALILYVCGGPAAFLLLLTLFALTYIATRIGYARKQDRGLAEPRDGRNALQVLANVGVAATCALIYCKVKQPYLLLACTAALAESAADTVSSELGQVFRTDARLITTGKRVPAGTDGGVTLPGTAAGSFAAAILAGIAAFTGVIPGRWAPLATLAGIAGMLLDSVLGATGERKGRLSNDAVNALGTLSASLLGIALSRI